MYFDNAKFNAAYAKVADHHIEWKTDIPPEEIPVLDERGEQVKDRKGNPKTKPKHFISPESTDPAVLAAKNIMARELDKIISRVLVIFKGYPSDFISDVRADTHLHCWKRMKHYDPTRYKAFNFFTSVVINKIRTEYTTAKIRRAKTYRIESYPSLKQLGF